MPIPLKMLGQSGCKIAFPELTLFFDPYLSNSVKDLDNSAFDRQVEIPLFPEQVDDADLVLISHDHLDHCDPHTLPQLSIASPHARFIGPASVLMRLSEWGIDESRLVLAQEDWTELAPEFRLRAVPAAHPEIERDERGNLKCIGFLLDYKGWRIYFAGDTFARQEIIDAIVEQGPVSIAFLPVNEHNFFKKRQGIVGNMSVHEAFQFAVEIGAKQVVAVHWDMFKNNSVNPDEIKSIYHNMSPGFELLLGPTLLNLGDVRASVIIRTLNEATFLDSLLTSIEAQQAANIKHEVIVVDSGSTDGTLEIAKRNGCRICSISREEFSFGRSLNLGCSAALGEILIFISGHCVPTDQHWLQRLCQPILDGRAEYVYGRQFGGEMSHFSEHRIFAKYYPDQSFVPQDGFFCNNANSALLSSVWEKNRFDEELTGLEDMELAQRLVLGGGRIAYVSDAAVFHHHNESWAQIRRRFEREAIALQKIMPQVQLHFFDTIRYFVTSVCKDWVCACREKETTVRLVDVIRYRWNQYIGSWKGNHQHRKLSIAEKEKYFYPH